MSSARPFRAIGLILARALAIFLLIPYVYALVALIGGLIPVNTGWAPPADGITIHVETNGIHTGIVMPVRSPVFDWSRIAPAADLSDPRRAGSHIAIGWGERDFYLNTPDWSQARPATILRAVTGSDRTLMHVDHGAAPAPGPGVKAIVLTPDQYRRLVAFIVDRFALTPDGRAVPVRGYGPADIFYAARGHYDAIDNCNEWTGAALRHAGVRVGAWTPISAAVMLSIG